MHKPIYKYVYIPMCQQYPLPETIQQTTIMSTPGQLDCSIEKGSERTPVPFNTKHFYYLYICHTCRRHLMKLPYLTFRQR